jgi:two-component system sensor histidine kinase/response regulator
MMSLDLSRCRVLVVDDVESHLEILVNALANDYDVLAATNGEEALALAGKDRPDLILLDILMPGMDGYEVCRRLKENAETRDIPVIFITVMTEVNHEQRGLDLGAVDYIRKPFSPAIVKARVRNHLRMRAAFLEVERQNHDLLEAAAFREEVEQVTRHDLKGPLTSIIGLPRLVIKMGGLNPEQQRWLESVEKAGLRMLEQINFSLDLFRMERGMYQLEPAEVNLLPVARNTVRDQLSLWYRKGLQIDMELGSRSVEVGDRFPVRGEEMLIYSLFANLVKNACEAAPNGAIIRVTFQPETQAFTVRNPGEVPEEVRERFFDKLVSHGKSGGHGLGTYSAKLIMDLHGGSISVDTSEPGHTSVTCRFPAGP